MLAIPSCYTRSTASPLPTNMPVLTVLPGGWQAQSPEPERLEVCELEPRSGVFRAKPRLDASSDDAVLARAAAEGSHLAAAIIVKRHTPRVRSKLHHWIGPTDIDDRVQEVFIRLFEQLPRLRDPNALRGFLIGVTLRIACTELRRRRKEAQPSGIKTFGSTFKNPEDPRAQGRTAGQLLDGAGCRGLSVGGAGFSAKHANFVENHGDATTADVVALMHAGRLRVIERFGVELEAEVQALGPVEFPADWRLV